MKQSSALGTTIAIAGVIAISWMALRSMSAKQQRAFADAGAQPSSQAAPALPPALIGDAAKVSRLEIVLRVDGLDLTLDGAPLCRDGHRRLVQRAPGGEAGSFDDKALAACLDAARIAERKPIALVSLAGPLVPTTFRDALIASLKRAGVADAIATP